MAKYEPQGVQFLVEDIERIRSEISAIRRDLKEHDDWRERLTRHDQQIGLLLEGLEKETITRKSGEDKFSTAIDSLNKSFNLIKGGAMVLYVLLGAFLVVLVEKICGSIFK
jgi:septal ring factor EnvC (AmiA/AmiB activator)